MLTFIFSPLTVLLSRQSLICSSSLYCCHFKDVELHGFQPFEIFFIKHNAFEIHLSCICQLFCYFLLLSVIPLHGWIYQTSTTHPLKDIWVVYGLLLLQMKTLKTYMQRFLCKHKFLWDKCPRL